MAAGHRDRRSRRADRRCPGDARGARRARAVPIPWQGRGIAHEATATMCTWLTTQGVERLVAHIHPEHHASAKVADAIGLTPTGDLDADGECIWAGTTEPITSTRAPISRR